MWLLPIVSLPSATEAFRFETFRCAQTPALIAELERLGPESPETAGLLTILGTSGDPDRAVPLLLRWSEGAEPKPKAPRLGAWYGSLFALSFARDPRARAAVAHRYRKGMSYGVAQMLYWSRAGSAAPEAVREARAARGKRRLLRPLRARMELDKLGPEETTQRLATRVDAKGRMWGLFQSGILGHRGDLWLLERRNGRWDRPLFTGVRRDSSSQWTRADLAEPTIGGRTGDELADGAWFETLVGREEISRDTDHDGLNDPAEARLGTDPRNRDTDGDGEGDETDPMPTAPLRALNDEEAIFAAAFEAFGRIGRPSDRPYPRTDIVTMPDEIAPFEMVTRSGPLLWRTRSESRDPAESPGEPRQASVRYEFPSSESDTGLIWNPDRTFAYLSLSWLGGPKRGAVWSIGVKRVGTEWFAVDMTHSAEF